MKWLVTILFLFPIFVWAQTADASFHIASNQYIHNKVKEALTTVDEALKRYPNDPKLNALKEKLKQDQQQNDQNKENKDDQKNDEKEKQKNEQNKDDQKQQKQDQQQQEKEQQQKEQQKQKEQQEKPASEQSEKKEQDKKDLNLDRQKLEEMKMSEEKARMILEAMRNQEKQYLQQQKRKPTKSRNNNKPDW